MPAITKDEAIKVLRDAANFAAENFKYPFQAAQALSEALAATEHITEAAATQAAGAWVSKGIACSVCYGTGFGVDGKRCTFNCAPYATTAPATVPTDLSIEISDLRTLAEKLHAKWGDCLWLDASELMALGKAIEYLVSPAAPIKAVEVPPLPEWAKMDDLGGRVPSEIRQELNRRYREGYAAGVSATLKGQTK
jgi:hypothetical protein